MGVSLQLLFKNKLVVVSRQVVACILGNLFIASLVLSCFGWYTMGSILRLTKHDICCTWSLPNAII